MEKEKIDDDLTYKIIGCAMKVHATLGNGFSQRDAFGTGSHLSKSPGDRDEKKGIIIFKRIRSTNFL